MWLIVTGSRFASGLPRVIIYIVQLNLKIPLTSSSNEAPGTFLKAPARLYLGNKDGCPSTRKHLDEHLQRQRMLLINPWGSAELSAP